MECKWKDHFLLPEQKFPRENRISWKVAQNSQTEFPNENVCSICLFLLVPGLLAWIVFDRETTKLIKDGFTNVAVQSVWAFGAWYGSSFVLRVCWWSFATIRWVIWVKYALCGPEKFNSTKWCECWMLKLHMVLICKWIREYASHLL